MNKSRTHVTRASPEHLRTRLLTEQQNQRPRYQAPTTHVTEMYSYYGAYGQEVSFSILSKTEVELKWSGSSPPSQEFVNAVNSYLKRYYPKNEMRPLGKNRFACALKWYKQIVDLAHKQNIEAKDIPQTVLTAMSLCNDDSSSSDQNRLTAEQLKDLQCLPEKLIATLADFQKVGCTGAP